jgi:hypothetical protein
VSAPAPLHEVALRAAGAGVAGGLVGGTIVAWSSLATGYVRTDEALAVWAIFTAAGVIPCALTVLVAGLAARTPARCRPLVLLIVPLSTSALMAGVFLWTVGLIFQGGPEGAVRELSYAARWVATRPGQTGLVAAAGALPVLTVAWARLRGARLVTRAILAGIACVGSLTLGAFIERFPGGLWPALFVAGLVSVIAMELGERGAMRLLERRDVD